MNIRHWLAVFLLAGLPSLAAAGDAGLKPGATAGAQQAGERVRLAARFQPGQVLRYQVEFRTLTESRSTGPVADPQGATTLEVTVNLRVRLEVLDPARTAAATEAASQAGPAAVHFRATYEQAAAVVTSDVPDPEATDIEAWYRSLEGRTLEIFVGADKVFTDLTGLGDLAQDPRAASAQEWLTQLLRGIPGPAEGVLPGQKWSREEPVANAPLAGLAWRVESTYLRNEPCRAAQAVPQPAPPGEELCAVVLTRFQMLASSSGDPTPPDYRQRGLRTSGKLTGSGESLSYVALAGGLLVSATQTATEEMDLLVSSEDGARVHYLGRVSSTSHITLLRDAP